MRTVCNTFLAALVVVALFWGNCFTCPQVLMAMKAHASPHGCCHRSQKAPKSCQTQVLGHFVKNDSAKVAAPAVVENTVSTAVMLPVLFAIEVPEQYVPPDLVSLHTDLRI